jgi:methylthioribose-1-phosphate isomerase
VLTHCNTGALATGGYGSALGAVRAAWEAGHVEHVWVDETRPLLQGARLTAWELDALGIPFSVIVDGAAASLMAAGEVDAALTGADRIAANGDVANKVGTYGLAVAASRHEIPLYVVAPTTTLDPSVAQGRTSRSRSAIRRRSRRGSPRATPPSTSRRPSSSPRS